MIKPFRRSNCYKHGVNEFKILASLDANEKPIVLDFKKEILALIDKFGKSGQSGGSAPYVSKIITDTIEKLLSYKTLSPIKDEGWVEVSKELFQNKRDGRIFKENNQCYFIDAVVFEDESKSRFTTQWPIGKISSRGYIKNFPFEPKTFYVNVVTDGENYKIKDKKQLKEVLDYYSFKK